MTTFLLAPCPFCGSDPVFGQVEDENSHDDGGHFIQCSNAMCAASTRLVFACGDDPKPLLAGSWNKRNPVDGLWEAITRLENRLEILRDALTDIKDRHLGDCPQALAHLTQLEWAYRCHAGLRSTARNALADAGYKP